MMGVGIDARGTHARAAGVLDLQGHSCGDRRAADRDRRVRRHFRHRADPQADRRRRLRDRGRIARRVDSIERALYQFQVLQTQGVLLGALSTGDGMREDFRRSFLQLGFLVRKGPTARMIQELNATDLAAFRRDARGAREAGEAALPADDKAAWDDSAEVRDGSPRAGCATCTDQFLDHALRG